MYSIQYKKINKELSIEENFMLALEEERNSGKDHFKGLDIFYHLFFMLQFYNKDFLSYTAEQYTDGPNDWFFTFHKQFRQVDMFDGAGFYERKIKEEELQKRKELLQERDRYIKENKPSYKDFKDEKEWYEKDRDFFQNDGGLEEIQKKLKPYNALYNSYKMQESFGGHMDMVMWLSISQDKDNSLYRFMDEFLAMYLGVRSYENKKLFSEKSK